MKASLRPVEAVARGFFSVALTVAMGCGSPQAPPEPPAARPNPEVATQTEDPLFLEVAKETGLLFTHWNGMSGELYYPEMMGSGVALFDYDNDGDLDVYLVQGNALGSSGSDGASFAPPGELPLSDRLFRNDSSPEAELPRFTDVTDESELSSPGYGMGVTAADFDNDGWIDLYVTNLERNQVFRNRGPGADGRVTFEDVSATSGAALTAWSVPAVAFDYDADGWLDLFVGNYVGYSVTSDPDCVDELGVPNYCGPLTFDALPDVLLRNRGGIVFEDVSRRAGIADAEGGCLGAVATDFDGDGRLDLYVANDGMPNRLWINSAEGRFEDRALLGGAAVSGLGNPEASMGVAAADFDADGDEDLFVAHLRNETNTVYVNNGRGQFEDRSAPTGLGAPSLPMTGFGTGWLDIDNDGWLDQLTVNGAVKVIKTLRLAGDPFPLHQPNQLFRHRGAQHNDATMFEDISSRAGEAFRLSEVSRGAAFGDIDNDGDTDVVINNNSGPARLLLNQVGHEGAWLGLRLLDAASKRDALGARAGLMRDGQPTLWRRVGAPASYASSSDPRLLFGLGDTDTVAKIVVRWPDGRSEQWPGSSVKLGAYTTLVQGSGESWQEGSS